MIGDDTTRPSHGLPSVLEQERGLLEWLRRRGWLGWLGKWIVDCDNKDRVKGCEVR